MLLAMVRCAIGDEHRSVATARRQFFDLTGFMPEESSFYDRLTPAFADLAWQQFLRVLACAIPIQRLQDALVAFSGTVLLVSHDDGLAARCTTTTWQLTGGALEVRGPAA